VVEVEDVGYDAVENGDTDLKERKLEVSD